MEKAVKKQKTLEVRRTKNMIKIMKKLFKKKVIVILDPIKSIS